MIDDLLNRLQIGWHDEDTPLWVSNAMFEAKDRIEVLTAQLESTLKDRKLILEERDRTFALMLARVEKAEADNARLLDHAVDLFRQVRIATYSGMAVRREIPAVQIQILADIDAAEFCAALNGKEPSHEVS